MCGAIRAVSFRLGRILLSKGATKSNTASPTVQYSRVFVQYARALGTYPMQFPIQHARVAAQFTLKLGPRRVNLAVFAALLLLELALDLVGRFELAPQ